MNTQQSNVHWGKPAPYMEFCLLLRIKISEYRAENFLVAKGLGEGWGMFYPPHMVRQVISLSCLVQPSVLYIGSPGAEKTNPPALTDLHLMEGLAARGRKETNEVHFRNPTLLKMNQRPDGRMNASCWYSKTVSRSMESFHTGQIASSYFVLHF